MPSLLSSLASRTATLRRVRQRHQFPVFTESLCTASLTPWLMRMPLAQLEALLERWFAWSFHAHASSPDSLADTVLAAVQLGRPLIRTGCLTRGLTLYCMLRRTGIAAELVFGMGRSNTADGMDGHCWVTLDGEPFREPRDPREVYVTMYTLGASSAQRAAAVAA